MKTILSNAVLRHQHKITWIGLPVLCIAFHGMLIVLVRACLA